MTTSTLQQLREKIIEAVPEIMKMEFGCQIRLLHEQTQFAYDMYKAYGKKIWTYDDTSKFVCGFAWMDANEFFGHKESWEVIGRPIQLADVLRAIGRKSDTWHITGDGAFCLLNPVTGDFERVAVWNLAQNLDDQESAVHEFLLSVIS